MVPTAQLEKEIPEVRMKGSRIAEVIKFKKLTWKRKFAKMKQNIPTGYGQ